MVPNTPARDALAAKLAEVPRKISVTDLASQISITRVIIYAWLNRRQRPEQPYRLALERALGIPSGDWLTEDERRVAFGDGSDVKAAG